MCIAQKHFYKFNKQYKPSPREANPADNLFCPLQKSSMSTIGSLNSIKERGALFVAPQSFHCNEQQTSEQSSGICLPLM